MDMKKLLVLFSVFMALSGLAMAETTLNDSLYTIVNVLPIVALAIVAIAGIVGSVISIIILIMLVIWVRDVLYIPLDLIKGAMKDMRMGRGR